MPTRIPTPLLSLVLSRSWSLSCWPLWLAPFFSAWGAGLFPAPPAGFEEAHPANGGRGADPVRDEALELHRRAIVVDTHADTTQRIVYYGARFVDGIPEAHLDLPKMRLGGVDAQFFSIFIYPRRTPPAAFFSESLRQVKVIQDMVAASAGQLSLARTARDVRANADRGVPSVLLGVEGGHSLGPGDHTQQLAHLRRLAAEGVRYMTLTWTNSNDIGGSSGDEGDGRGLTEFGRRVLDEMQRLGVIIDLSHVSDPLFWDAIRYVKKPVILSHSSSRALANVPRNVSDAMLRAVARNGGAVCVNFNPGFLDAAYNRAQAPLWARFKDLPIEETYRRVRDESLRLPPVPLSRLADHVVHMIEIAGVDHVCLGSDFDGIPATPAGLEDASRLPALTIELRRRRVAASDVEKILGTNTLRVLQSNDPR
jgi:membrane dipeptidase